MEDFSNFEYHAFIGKHVLHNFAYAINNLNF